MSTYIPADLRRQVRADAGRRCGYCLSPEMLMGISLEIEHILPEVAGGLTIRENLWRACHSGNKFKGGHSEFTDPVTKTLVPLFNPRFQRWREHFQWSSEGTLIIGLTSCGRATIEALQMNNEYIVEARHLWVIASWHPPAN
jgi:5-methylcytosine-specific restriction endonuclease McrA